MPSKKDLSTVDESTSAAWTQLQPTNMLLLYFLHMTHTPVLPSMHFIYMKCSREAIK